MANQRAGGAFNETKGEREQSNMYILWRWKTPTRSVTWHILMRAGLHATHHDSNTRVQRLDALNEGVYSKEQHQTHPVRQWYIVGPNTVFLQVPWIMEYCRCFDILKAQRVRQCVRLRLPLPLRTPTCVCASTRREQHPVGIHQWSFSGTAVTM